MKVAERILCLLLVLSVVFAMTGCKKASFSQEDVCKYAEDLDFEELDEVEDLYDYVGVGGRMSVDGYVYISLKGQAAEDLFYSFTYRFEPDHPHFDVTETTALYAADDDGICNIITATFEDTKEAEKFFKKYSKSLDYGNEDQGNERSYSYYIGTEKSAGTRTLARALYLSGNTVILLNTSTHDFDVAGDFCDHFKLISPQEA